LKNKKLFLDTVEEEAITVGLIKLAHHLPCHEVFFKINQLNFFQFCRMEDIMVENQNHLYHFPRFEAYDCGTQTSFVLIANMPDRVEKVQEHFELFDGADENKYLLSSVKDIDYIVTSQEECADFSVIQLPQDLIFEIQEYSINPNEDLYQLIHYYE
jgi:hypothetical protein